MAVFKWFDPITDPYYRLISLDLYSHERFVPFHSDYFRVTILVANLSELINNYLYRFNLLVCFSETSEVNFLQLG